MDDETFQQKLRDIMREMSELSVDEATKKRLKDQAEQVKATFARGKQVLEKMQENMAALRIGVKYLVFDLEATRRENEQLRQMLHSRGIDPDEQG
jgi:heme oxygenase